MKKNYVIISIILTIILLILLLDRFQQLHSSTFVIYSNFNNKALAIIHGKNLETGVNKNRLKQVKISIIDSGFYSENKLNLIQLNKISNDKSSDHGFIIANLIAYKKNKENNFSGILPNNPIYYYDIPKKQLNVNSLIKAITVAIKKNVDVINISLTTTEKSKELLGVIHKAVQNGIVIVASAGNDGTNELEYPASFNIHGLISVGAINDRLNIPTYSNVNPEVDIYAPGENIYSMDPKSNKVKTFSGTSLSAPFVTIAVALLKAKHPNFTPSKIENRLIHSADVIQVHWGFQTKVIHLLDLKKLLKRM